MLDGVVPEGNISDDRDTWSPLVEIEDAAENVLNGRSEGSLVLSERAAKTKSWKLTALLNPILSLNMVKAHARCSLWLWFLSLCLSRLSQSWSFFMES
jgi:hypothetical protein